MREAALDGEQRFLSEAPPLAAAGRSPSSPGAVLLRAQDALGQRHDPPVAVTPRTARKVGRPRAAPRLNPDSVSWRPTRETATGWCRARRASACRSGGSLIEPGRPHRQYELAVRCRLKRGPATTQFFVKSLPVHLCDSRQHALLGARFA